MSSLGQELRGTKGRGPTDWSRHATGDAKQGSVRARKKGKRMYQFPNSVQLHIDREDKRIKELTEGILYEFLPAALNVMVPNCDDPGLELKPERCRAVAGAALCVAALMNAPPGFLEFLCCVPWSNLAELYPSFRPDAIEALMPQLNVSAEERAALINMRLEPALMDCVMDFLYASDHAESVPPIIQLSKGNEVHVVTRETVAALLDGATPLHCAAIRGNPAQVEHLIAHGADVYCTTSAGEVPLELIPVCKRGKTKDTCRCMFTQDQQVWKCMSGEARQKLARMSLGSFRNGVFAWLKMCMLVLLCMLGLWGQHSSLDRPSIDRHLRRRSNAKRQDARVRSQMLIDQLRADMAAGQDYLAKAQQAVAASQPPLAAVLGLAAFNNIFSDQEQDDAVGMLGLSQGDPLGDAQLVKAALLGRTQVPVPEAAAEDAEKAFELFVKALHALQGLDLRGSTLAAGFSECGLTNVPHLHVREAEQAALYCSWAQSVLLKFRSCTCQACGTLAAQSIRLAHSHGSRLLARVEPNRAADPSAWESVGKSLVRVLHTHICLLAETEARHSVTRASVWQAFKCLQEWESLRAVGLTANMQPSDVLQVQALEAWAKRAESDLSLAEALSGSPMLPMQSLAEVLSTAIVYDMDGNPFLVRSVDEYTPGQLDSALRLAVHSSMHLVRLTETVAENTRGELESGAALRELLTSKQPTTSLMAAMQALQEAITAAAAYPHLEDDVHEALALRERWIKRAHAVAHLESIMETVQQQPTCKLTTGSLEEQAAFNEDWAARLDLLNNATEAARKEGISINKAKRLTKDLQGQAMAVEAAIKLDELLAATPCGSAAIKGLLNKAESVASAAASNLSGLTLGSDFLAPRLQAARRQLEVERAAENLARAAQTSRAVESLPKLEAAILAAKKVGAEELDPEAYRAASDMRAKLDLAARHRAQLEVAIRLLQRSNKLDDADVVAKLIDEALDMGDLLSADVSRAQGILGRWRSAAALEQKLARTLREGGTAHQLSRAIQEAAAVGVQVGDARKVLKLVQNLEAAVQAASDSPAQPLLLKSRIDAAEQGNCSPLILAAPKQLLLKLQVAEVKASLEAALKPRAAQPSTQRRASLQVALSKVASVLGEGWEDITPSWTNTPASQANRGVAGHDGSEGEGNMVASSHASGQAKKTASGSLVQPVCTENEGVNGRELRDSVKEQHEGQEAATALSQAETGPATSSKAVDTALSAGRVTSERQGDVQSAGRCSGREGSDEHVSPVAAAMSGDSLTAAPGTAGSEAASGTQLLAALPVSVPPALVEEVLSLWKMAVAAQMQLLESQRERERLDAERQEEQRLRREKQLKDREEREQQIKEKAEREKADRERAGKERAARLEKERQVQEVLAALTDHSSYAAVKAQREKEAQKEREMESNIPVRRAIPISRLNPGAQVNDQSPAPPEAPSAAPLKAAASNASETMSLASSEAGGLTVSSVGEVRTDARTDASHIAKGGPGVMSQGAGDHFLQGLPTESILQSLVHNSHASQSVPSNVTTSPNPAAGKSTHFGAGGGGLFGDMLSSAAVPAEGQWNPMVFSSGFQASQPLSNPWSPLTTTLGMVTAPEASLHSSLSAMDDQLLQSSFLPTEGHPVGLRTSLGDTTATTSSPLQQFPDLGGVSWGLGGSSFQPLGGLGVDLSSSFGQGGQEHHVHGGQLGLHSPGSLWGPVGHATAVSPVQQGLGLSGGVAGTPQGARGLLGGDIGLHGAALSSSLGALGFVTRDDIGVSSPTTAGDESMFGNAQHTHWQPPRSLLALDPATSPHQDTSARGPHADPGMGPDPAMVLELGAIVGARSPARTQNREGSAVPQNGSTLQMQQHMHTSQILQQLCPDYQRGFCRSGSSCPHQHGTVAPSGTLPPALGLRSGPAAQQPSPTLSSRTSVDMPPGVDLRRSGNLSMAMAAPPMAGNLAFGAPGSAAFSNLLGQGLGPTCGPHADLNAASQMPSLQRLSTGSSRGPLQGTSMLQGSPRGSDASVWASGSLARSDSGKEAATR